MPRSKRKGVEIPKSPKSDTSAQSGPVQQIAGTVDELAVRLENAMAELQNLKDNPHMCVQEAETINAIAQRTSNEIDSIVQETAHEISGHLEALTCKLQAVFTLAIQEGLQGNKAKHDAAESRRNRLFSEKEFAPAQSLLSTMLQQKDFSTIYHMFIAVLIWLFVNIIISEVLEEQRHLDISILFVMWSSASVVFPLWTAMFITSFSVIPLVYALSHHRGPWQLWAGLYILLQACMLSIPSYIVVSQALPPAAGFACMCEMARFFMKMHSYMREKILWGTDRLAVYKDFIPDYAKAAGVTVEHLHQPSVRIRSIQTEIGRYLYFLFAPTLIYRDHYPRTSNRIRWLSALVHLVNCTGCVLYAFALFNGMCMPYFEQTYKHPGDAKTFLMSVFRAMMPGMIMYFMAFFGLLHSWLNLWAELLRFADRRFYFDWWNSRSWGTYYRKWNGVVHDWLFYYLYRDIQRFMRGRIGRGGAQLLVFVFSALIHEQIIACGTGFFYPILLLMFGGPGVVFVSITKGNQRHYNIFMWLMLSVGLALLMVLYSHEYFARMGAGAELFVPISDYEIYLPRSWVLWWRVYKGKSV